MAGERVINNVNKKIVWEFSDLTEEQITFCENRTRIESKAFKIVFGDIETKWALSLYPNGNRIETKSHIGLFLSLKESTSYNFDASFKLGIASEEFEKTFFKNLVRTGEKLKTNGWGIEKLINHAQLFDPKNKFFVDEKFFLVCELELTTNLDGAAMSSSLGSIENLGFCFRQFFENKCFSDIGLKSKEGDVLKAHKVVLAARSPVIFAMLVIKMEDATVDIPDLGTKTLKELLRFIYRDEVWDLDGIARELIFAAEKYDLEPLKNVCLESIIKTLTIENVVETFLISDQLSRSCNTKTLVNKCLDLIVKNYQIISKTEDWQKLSKQLLTKIIDRIINTIYV